MHTIKYREDNLDEVLKFISGTVLRPTFYGMVKDKTIKFVDRYNKMVSVNYGDIIVRFKDGLSVLIHNKDFKLCSP